jgi:hypothetical protein
MSEKSASRQPIIWEDTWALDTRLRIGPELKGRWPMESFLLRGNRQLLVDNLVIEHMDNLQKVLHQPTKHEANPVLIPDRPWEGNRAMGVAVIRDEEAGHYKLWYRAESGWMAYATSDDCIYWDKPNLGIRESDGSKDNNLVELARVGDEVVNYRWDGNVIDDPLEADPARRYKYFGVCPRPVFGIYVAFSPDGIRWEGRPQPVLDSSNEPALADKNSLMVDTARGRYVGITKREMVNPFGRGDYGMIHRCQCVTFSDDFETWTDPLLALRPDDRDPPEMQVYGMMGFNYEGMYLGLADMFWSGETGPRERTIDIQLVCSRDAETWWRAGDRQTFIPTGGEGSWDPYLVIPLTSPPVEMNDELWFFYSGSAQRHRYALAEHRRREPWSAPGHPEDPPLAPGAPRTAMGIARLRRDGFVSVDAGPDGGRLLTKPLVFEGEYLRVNADARRGSIRAELFEAKRVEGLATRNSAAMNWAIEEPLPGYSLEDSIPLETDTTDGVLRWRDSGGIGQLSGRYIVIRFHLADASLYSFWVE